MMTVWIEYILAPIVGFIAGFIGTLLGIGGGSVMVPTLVLIGIDIKKVVPASLFAILGTSAGGLRKLYNKGLVDYKLAFTLELASVTGALIGVYFFGKESSSVIEALLGSVLIGTGFLFLYRQKKGGSGGREYTDNPVRLSMALLISLLAGFLSATLGIGGGVLKVPILVVVLGLEIHKAVSTSKLMVGITALTGVIGYIYTGHLDIILALLLLAGTYLGAKASAGVMLELKGKWLMIIAASYYFIMGITMILKSI
jgi:uncharacterized membrane protein YfcA